MMHNTYISSSLFSLSTNGSLSFSLNDCSNLLNERFENDPLLASRSGGCCSCSCSCCGSSFANCRVNINPSLFYGLRQSSLIQWSLSKRLILGGREKDYCRVPGYGIDNCDYEVSCSFKERSDSGRVESRGKGKGRFGSVNSRGRRWFSGVDDVDAVISLLSEEVSKECSGDRGRKWSLLNRMDLEKVENRESYGGEFHHARKNNVRLEGLESDSKDESISVELRKERCDRREEKEKREERKQYRKRREMEEREAKEQQKAVLKGENHKGRKASSSFSSYYSFSSSGEFESDKEAQEEHGDFMEGSSSRYVESRNGASRFEGQMEEEVKSHRDRIKSEEVQRDGATRTAVEWDLRKDTEKKLTEVEETQFRKEHSQSQSRIARSHESDYTKALSLHKQIDNEEVKSSSAVNLEKGTRKQFCQVANEVAEQSDFRCNYQQVADIQEIHGKSSKITCQGQKQVSTREENLPLDEDLVWERRDSRYKLDSERAGKDNLRKKDQNFIGMLEIGKVDTDRVSHQERLSGSRMKIKSEDGAVIAAGDANELRYQTAEKTSRQTELRRCSGKISVTNAHDGHSKKTSILQSGTSVKNQEGSTTVASSSGSESKAHKSTRDEGNIQMIQLSQESQDVTNISVNVTNVSVVHAETVKDSGGTSENRITNQGNGSLSVVKPIRHPTDESIATFKLTSGPQSASNMLDVHEGTSQETFGTESSVNVVSQLRVQQMGREHVDERSQQLMVVSPSMQLADRGSLCSGSSQVVSEESLETGSGAWDTNSGWRTQASRQEPSGTDQKSDMYGKPLNLHSPEDALGSAQRLQESTMQFVGEFIEKARHKASTSEILNEKTISDMRLLHESEKIRQKNLEQYGSEGIQFKELGSRKSSGVSGVKGPSDEMWDVRDPSTQEPQEIELPVEATGNENIVVRRSGKSLWNIISNIVRLHWGSHGETPRSDRKSGGKSSSNDSVSSEAWFSGNEPDENSDENAKKERRSTPHEATSSDKLRRRQISAKGQGEAADKRRQIKSDASSPLVVLQSTTSTGISSPSHGANLAKNQESKIVEIPPSDMEIGSSFLILMASSSGTSGGIGEVSSVTGETALSGSVSMSQTELPATTKSTDEQLTSEGNEGELKQRRLQRNKQIPRDRFDAWEEAYILESEQRKVDEFFMREALLEAKKAADSWEVPVGAVLVQHGKIIARGYNLVEELRDSTAHAEMICIREASNQLRSWRLVETTLYVTLEPCPMCAGAILQARIDTLVWGAPNKLLGADGSWIRLFPNGEGGNASELTDKPAAPVHPFHPNMKIRRGTLASACADVMQQFFQLRRRKREKDRDPAPQPSCLPIASRQSKILTKTHDLFHAMLCL